MSRRFERPCRECGEHVPTGTAIATSFGVFHEGCYTGCNAFEKCGSHETSVDISMERPIIWRPKMSDDIKE